MPRGKFIVFYGINNVGKTTQAKSLVKRLKDAGKKAEYLKYPIYDLHPTGIIFNEYLRGGNPHNLTPREFQIIAAANRYQYQPELEEKLNQGITVVAEDYRGTSIAWGAGAGVRKDFLVRLNEGLLKEDHVFLLDGERFLSASEKNHRHEADNDLTKKVRRIHRQLAQEYGWQEISANQPAEVIEKIVWKTVTKLRMGQ